MRSRSTPGVPALGARHDRLRPGRHGRAQHRDRRRPSDHDLPGAREHRQPRHRGRRARRLDRHLARGARRPSAIRSPPGACICAARRFAAAQDVGWLRELTVGKMMIALAAAFPGRQEFARVPRAFPLGSANVVVAVGEDGRYLVSSTSPRRMRRRSPRTTTAARSAALAHLPATDAPSRRRHQDRPRRLRRRRDRHARRHRARRRPRARHARRGLRRAPLRARDQRRDEGRAGRGIAPRPACANVRAPAPRRTGQIGKLPLAAAAAGGTVTPRGAGAGRWEGEQFLGFLRLWLRRLGVGMLGAFAIWLIAFVFRLTDHRLPTVLALAATYARRGRCRPATDRPDEPQALAAAAACRVSPSPATGSPAIRSISPSSATFVELKAAFARAGWIAGGPAWAPKSSWGMAVSCPSSTAPIRPRRSAPSILFGRKQDVGFQKPIDANSCASATISASGR